MDPYYFLDLEIEYPENTDEEICDLSEFTSMNPDGDWEVGCNDEDFDEYKILYGEEEYSYIYFNNTNKTVYFCRNGKIIKQLKITFTEVPIEEKIKN